MPPKEGSNSRTARTNSWRSWCVPVREIRKIAHWALRRNLYLALIQRMKTQRFFGRPVSFRFEFLPGGHLFRRRRHRSGSLGDRHRRFWEHVARRRLLPCFYGVANLAGRLRCRPAREPVRNHAFQPLCGIPRAKGGGGWASDCSRASGE